MKDQIIREIEQSMLSCTKVMLFTWIFLCNDI